MASTNNENDDKVREQPPSTTKRSSSCNTVAITIFCLWIAATSLKILLFPAYRSTDFAVHRHWKAVARNLPVSQWYYDDQYVQTRHTVDYPPGFMLYVEYFWGNVVAPLVLRDDEDKCLALWDDAQLEAATITPACTAFLRTTVILSDSVWWLSAYAVSSAVAASARTHRRFSWLLFGLLAFHPALLLLDHVHFQYNGLLLGLLMLSLACLMHANNNYHNNCNNHGKSDTSETKYYHLGAAALFALLITMKHLYITCSAWFVVYLARRYCSVEVEAQDSESNIQSNNSTTNRIRVAWGPLLQLILCGSFVLVLPFAIFVGAVYLEQQHHNGDRNHDFIEAVHAWMCQLAKRLFPFERGLVHDYWAGNVWALYTVAVKAVRFVGRRLVLSTNNDAVVADSWLDWFQNAAVTPAMTVLATLVSQIPAWRLAHLAAKQRSNALLLQSFTAVALVSFLFQYHAHEKAVLTALVPATVWAVFLRIKSNSGEGDTSVREHSISGGGTTKSSKNTQDVDTAWSFLWQFSALAVLGLFPLLFRPQELLLKVSGYFAYLGMLQYFSPREQRPLEKRRRVGAWIIVLLTILQLECVPLQRLVYGRFQFAPLAVTSLVCASGIVQGLLETNSNKLHCSSKVHIKSNTRCLSRHARLHQHDG